jgi:hypothetical protein
MSTHTFIGVLAGLGLLEAFGIGFIWSVCRAAARKPLPSSDDALRNRQP